MYGKYHCNYNYNYNYNYLQLQLQFSLFDCIYIDICM